MITCKYNPQPKKQAKELQRAAAGEGKAGRKSQGGGRGRLQSTIVIISPQLYENTKSV
jgi:hypothetical protein